MNSLWDESYKASEIRSPKNILDEQCTYLFDQTNGQIIAKNIIMKKNKRDFEYRDIDDNIINEITQDDLFLYEFILTSKIIPNYKYRIMTYEYEIPFYPVYVSLDDEISSDINVSDEINCESEDDFILLLAKILKSKKVNNVISSLLALIRDEINNN